MAHAARSRARRHHGHQAASRDTLLHHLRDDAAHGGARPPENGPSGPEGVDAPADTTPPICAVWVVDLTPERADVLGTGYGHACTDQATHLGVVGREPPADAVPSFPLCDPHAAAWPNPVRKIVLDTTATQA